MIRTCSCLLVYLAVCSLGMADTLPVDANQLVPKGRGTVGLEDGTIVIRFDDPVADSGVAIKPPVGSGYWDLSGWQVLAVEVENLNPLRQMRLNLCLWGEGDSNGKRQEVNTGIALNPREKRTMKLLLPHGLGYDVPKGTPGPQVVNPARIATIEFCMQWPFERPATDLVHCRISNLRTEGRMPAAKVVPEGSFFPFIDRFGQYAHREWPEKIHADADLVEKRKEESATLAMCPRPAVWDRFGGWKEGPQLEATGSFRTEKYKGRWYFVDPDGKLFFSHGLDVLHAHTDATKTKDHERWFASPIPESGALAFTDTNLKIKYGKDDYASDFYDNLAKRLECWGFNTIGDWGNSALIEKRQLPYTLQLTDYDWKMPRIAGSKLKFYDVFDPAYVRGMKNLVSNAIARNPFVERSLSDPLCIGYFIDNELNFGNRRQYDLITAVLQSPPQQAMKQELVRDLKRRYSTIGTLNTAWGTDYQDWDRLLNSTAVPGMTEAFKTCAEAFTRRSVDQYFRLCRDAVKSVAPHRLYLGCRFISTDAVRPILYEASKKYCDVLSVNVYAHSVANLGLDAFPDMPVLIGEFHFGVLDRGMFSAGLCPSGITQEDRALAYTRFVQGALVNPLIVGAHWFQFRDQPLTGRWDGEGYAIGFVDVADTPYEAMTRASRAMGETMYAHRQAGRLGGDGGPVDRVDQEGKKAP